MKINGMFTDHTGHLVKLQGWWNGKTYTSNIDGCIRIYVSNEAYHITKKSFDEYLKKDNEVEKERMSNELHKSLKYLIMNAESNAEFEELLHDIFTTFQVNTKHNSKLNVKDEKLKLISEKMWDIMDLL